MTRPGSLLDDEITHFVYAAERLTEAIGRLQPGNELRHAHREILRLGTAASGLTRQFGHTTPTPGTRSGVWRRAGGHWEVGIDGTRSLVAHSKGIADISTLISAPGRDTSVGDLAGVVVERDVGPELDVQARRAIEERIIDLHETMAEAERHNDLGRIEKSHGEIDLLVTELSRAHGLHGHQRPRLDTVERARSTVTARIRAAIKRLYDVDRPLAAHLDSSVTTGRWCSYRAELRVEWNLNSA